IHFYIRACTRREKYSTKSNCSCELEATSAAMPVISKSSSPTFKALPTASAVPKYFLAILCVMTILFDMPKTLEASPSNRRKENILKKEESAYKKFFSSNNLVEKETTLVLLYVLANASTEGNTRLN